MRLPCSRIWVCVLSGRGQNKNCPKLGNGVRSGEGGHCLDNIPEMMGLKSGCARNFLESLFLLSFKPDFRPLALLDNASLLKHVDGQLSLERRFSLASLEFCGLARLCA